MTTSSTRSTEPTLAPVAVTAQGSFAVGGNVISREGTFDARDPMNPAGQTLHGEHARVTFQIPVDARPLPLLF